MHTPHPGVRSLHAAPNSRQTHPKPKAQQVGQHDRSGATRYGTRFAICFAGRLCSYKGRQVSWLCCAVLCASRSVAHVCVEEECLPACWALCQSCCCIAVALLVVSLLHAMKPGQVHPRLRTVRQDLSTHIMPQQQESWGQGAAAITMTGDSSHCSSVISIQRLHSA